MSEEALTKSVSKKSPTATKGKKDKRQKITSPEKKTKETKSDDVVMGEGKPSTLEDGAGQSKVRKSSWVAQVKKEKRKIKA